MKDQVAIVTGAGSPAGIGFACARALGEAGASVMITSTTRRIADRVRELQSRGIRAHGVALDLQISRNSSR
jgi:3-oxoacyl-[acyl-carrier protein] reductase